MPRCENRGLVPPDINEKYSWHLSRIE